MGNQREARKGSGDNVPRLGVWGMKSPNVPHREAIKKKSSQGAKRYLTVNLRKAGILLRIEKRPPEQGERRWDYSVRMTFLSTLR